MGKRGLRKGQWIFWVVAMFGWFAPAGVSATSDNLLTNGSFTANMGGWTGANGGASCSGGSPSLGLWGGPQLTFSYVQNSVTQQVNIPSPSNLELSFLASGEWGGTYSATLADSNESATTGVLTAGANQVSTLEINTTEANELVTVTFSGIDSLFWAGCYGPVIRNASLVATTAEPSMFGKVWENQTLILEAPAGSVFTGINFMSYGTPTGDNGNYAINQGCHATLSNEQQAQLLGQNTLVIGANNSVFGDPCPGTGKWLSVIATHSVPAATTTTTTTTIPQGSYSGGGCGPYSPIFVTGTTSGGGWGSGPFTDDSNFGAAAVFAGLIQPGQSAWLEPYDVNKYPSYVGGTNNGVTMSNWGGEWCGFNIKIFGTATPTTTTTTTTTTTVPKSLGQPINVTTSLTEDGLFVNWDAAANDIGVSPERYAISWSNGTSGWGIATGNVGDQNALNTSILLSYSLFQSTGGLGAEYSISVRADNDTFGVYSPTSSIGGVTVSPPPPPTTTTTEPEPITTEPETTLPPDTIPETPDTTDGGPDGGTGSSTDTTSPETTVPQPAPEEETPDTTPDVPLEEETPEAVVDDILANDPSPEELADAVGDALAATESEEELVDVAAELLTSELEPEQFAAVIEEVFSQDLSDEALTELVDTVFAEDLSDEEIAAVVTQVFTADISDEAFAEVLEAVFEEPLSDEAFTSVIDAILDEPISDEAFDELVDVLGSDTVSDEQVVAAVDTIIENGLTEEQSLSIATSGEVLESITGDQASEIFDTVPIGDISDAEAAALVEAVQDAPVEVKEAFETEINIFAAGNVDTYVPIGSNIPVSTRRVLIAATGLTLTMIPVPVVASSSRIGR